VAAEQPFSGVSEKPALSHRAEARAGLIEINVKPAGLSRYGGLVACMIARE